MNAASKCSPEMVNTIKNYINVTWTDAQTESKITSIIDDGISFLERIAGKELKFEEDTEAMRLLKHYSRYAYAGAESEFKEDYASDLAALNLSCKIEKRRKAKRDNEQ